MNLKVLILSIILFSISLSKAYAVSSYVLPYPSAMPGSVFYKLNLIKEYIQNFWYFGEFGQFSYNLKFSDKYLVEAKTLFEYNQFLLATEALNKSDSYFDNTFKFLNSAKKSKKDITLKKKIFAEAALKHIEVLESQKTFLPETFSWTPEKGKPTTLLIQKELDESKKIRGKFLDE